MLGELVMKGLGVVGPQPQRHAEAGLSTVEIGSGQRVSERKRDWLGGEHDGVRGSGCAREPQLTFVELGGTLDVADLEGNEIGACNGRHREILPLCCQGLDVLYYVKILT